MASTTEQIKEKLDLVEFIKGYLELKPAGRNFKALCPFHQEKTPSFIVSPERQIWHCFGCGEGGDIFRFLMRYENIEFHEALVSLAEKAGIELKKFSLADERQFGLLYEINQKAAEFFQEQLDASEEGKEYLKQRGLKPETLADFGVGLAPGGLDQLTVYLVNLGFSPTDILRAGLTVKTEKGQYRDRFRSRIIFPIHNHFGRIVAFSGRILPSLESAETAKYLNTPETPIFNKSKILYGFWRSKNFIAQAREALLVEGQMDYLLTWQDGVKNVTAVSGTALSSDHLRTLKRLADKLTLGFDLDEAGLRAAERSIDLAGAHDFVVYLLSLGEFADPAEAAIRQPGFISQALQTAKPAMSYYFDRYLEPENLREIESKKSAIRFLLGKLANLSSSIERSHWVRELAHRTAVPEKELLEELEKMRLGLAGPSKEAAEITPRKLNLTRRELIALRLLSLIVLKNDLVDLVEANVAFLPPDYQQALRALAPKEAVEAVDSKIQTIIDFVNLRSALEFGRFDEDTIRQETVELIQELKLEYFKERREAVREKIFRAEQSGDEISLLEGLKEFDDILRKMQDINYAQENKEVGSKN